MAPFRVGQRQIRGMPVVISTTATTTTSTRYVLRSHNFHLTCGLTSITTMILVDGAERYSPVQVFSFITHIYFCAFRMCTEQGPKYQALIKKLGPCRRLRNSIWVQHLRDLETAAASSPLPPRLSNPCPVAAPSLIAAPDHVASPIPTKYL